MRRQGIIIAIISGTFAAGVYTFAAINQAPVVNAGLDASVSGTYTLAGTCTDDGKPNPPHSLTCTWSKVSGPGTLTFSDTHLNTSTVSSTATGAHAIRYTATDSKITVTDDMVLTFTSSSPWPGSYTCINPATGSGTHNYYVCDCQSGADSGCTAGSDSNNGTSTSTPWQTFAKVVTTFNNTSLVVAGDTINFCKGGKWAASGSSTRMRNTNCTQATPCVFRDYQAGWGGSSKPYLQGASGGALFEFSEGGGCNDDGGYAILNLHLHGTATASGNRGIYGYNDVDDLTVCGCEIENFNVGISAAGQISTIGTGDGISSRWTIANNNFHDNAGWGTLGATPNWYESYNTFVNNGFDPHSALEHNIYLSEQNTGDNYSGEQIVGNDLTQGAYDGTNCNGAELVVHGNHTGLQILKNYIHEVAGHASGGCYGIEVAPGYADPESFTDTIIDSNIIVNVGSVGIGATSWLRGKIQNNVIVQNNSACGGTCGNDGILLPDTTRGSNDQAQTDVLVANNSIYIGSQNEDNGRGIVIGTEGTNYVAINNTIQMVGTQATWVCFSYPLSNTAYTAINGNSCYHPSASSAQWEQGTGNLAAWKATTGSPDANSIEGTNPNYSNAAASAPVYTTLSISGSPLRGAGVHTNAPTFDLIGTTRANPPSIGAYE